MLRPWWWELESLLQWWQSLPAQPVLSEFLPHSPSVLVLYRIWSVELFKEPFRHWPGRHLLFSENDKVVIRERFAVHRRTTKNIYTHLPPLFSFWVIASRSLPCMCSCRPSLRHSRADMQILIHTPSDRLFALFYIWSTRLVSAQLNMQISHIVIRSF